MIFILAEGNFPKAVSNDTGIVSHSQAKDSTVCARACVCMCACTRVCAWRGPGVCAKTFLVETHIYVCVSRSTLTHVSNSTGFISAFMAKTLVNWPGGPNIISIHDY